MKRSPAQLWLVVGLTALLAGCSRKTPEPVKTAIVHKAITFGASASNDGAGFEKLDPNDPKHGTRKLINLDVPVYVDGVQVAAFRYGDLPSIPVNMLEGGTPEYRIYDYLKGIGIAPESIKAVHFHGNADRIGGLEGAELLANKARFTFTFASQTTGSAVQRWDTEGLKNEFVFHEIRKVSVFVKKAPTPVHPQKRCHLGPDGECSDAVPYAVNPPAKGTRVYVDGKMVGFVKRRLIAETVVLGDTSDGDHKYGVQKFVASLGVDVSGVQAVEFVAGDEVIGRAQTAQWSKLGNQVYFTLPKHNHGKVRVHVPTEFQAQEEGAKVGDRDALITSVQVYRNTKPADRELVPISEDTDLSVQLANNNEEEGNGENAR